MINQLHQELITRAAGLGADELRVLIALATRLQRGSYTYGAMNLSKETRNLPKEREEELMDAIIYHVMEGLR